MSNRNAGTVSVRLSVKDKAAVEKALKSIGKEGEQALRKINKAGAPASRSLRAVSAASQEAQGRINALNGRVGGLGTVLSSMGGAGLAAGAAIGAVVVAVTALNRAAVKAADSMAELRGAAQVAGIDVESYQELEYAAIKLGVGQDALTDGLKEMQLRAQEFAERGAGPAVEAFQELGYSQEELAEKLKDAPALFNELIGKIGQLDKSAQLFSLDEIFGGTGGEQLVKIVNAGTDAMTAMIAEARALGVVIDERIVNEGARASKQLKALQLVIDRNVDRALIDLAPLAVALSEAFASAAREVHALIDAFRELDEQSDASLQGQMNRNSSRLAELDSQIERASNRDGSGSRQAQIRNNARLARLQQERRDLIASNEQIMQIFRQRQEQSPTLPSSGTSPRDTGDEIEKRKRYLDGLNRNYLVATNQRIKLINWEKDEQLKALDAMSDAQISAADRAKAREQIEATAAAKIAAAQEKVNKATGSGNSLMSEGQRITEQMQTASESYAQTLERLNQLLQAGAIDQRTYARAVDDAAKAFAEAERQKLSDSRSASAGIKLGIQSYADEATNAAQHMQQFTTSAFGGIEDALVSFVQTGKLEFKDLANSVIADLARIMIRQNITGPLAGLLGGGGGGSLFGLLGSLWPFEAGGVMSPSGPVPLRAYSNGGIADSPQVALYGEGRKPEAYVPLPDGRSIPVSMTGGGGGLRDLNLSISVVARFENDGNFKAYVDQVSTEKANQSAAAASQAVGNDVRENIRLMISQSNKNEG
nr:phage tail tape measure C-terminal domain-containing protein [uncultured Cohaesibacter sp.]